MRLTEPVKTAEDYQQELDECKTKENWNGERKMMVEAKEELGAHEYFHLYKFYLEKAKQLMCNDELDKVNYKHYKKDTAYLLPSHQIRRRVSKKT